MLNKSARIWLLSATFTLALSPITTIAAEASILLQGQGGPATPGGGQGQGGPAAPGGGQGQGGPAGQGQGGPAPTTGQGQAGPAGQGQGGTPPASGQGQTGPAAPAGQGQGGPVGQGQGNPAPAGQGQGNPVAPGTKGAPSTGNTQQGSPSAPQGSPTSPVGSPNNPVGAPNNGNQGNAPVQQGPGNPLVLPNRVNGGTQGNVPGNPGSPNPQGNGGMVNGAQKSVDAQGNPVNPQNQQNKDANAPNGKQPPNPQDNAANKIIGAPEGMDTMRDARNSTLGSADASKGLFSENGLEYYGYSFFASSRSLIDSRKTINAKRQVRQTRNSSIGNTADALITEKGVQNPLYAGTGTVSANNTVSGTPDKGSKDSGTVAPVEQPRVLALGDVQQAPTIDSNQTQSGTNQVVDNSNNPYQTIIGPADMMAGFTQAPNPDRYQLGPGDQFTLRVWSPTLDATESTILVDGRGDAIMPTGDRIQVRGLTLAQAESVFQRRLARKINNVQLTVTLKQLRTISITVLGESYAPGNYQMPSNVTMYNALYASGGPNTNGTLRKITLKRSDGTSRVFDFYRYLQGADSVQDLVLQPGDVLFIPPVETRVAVKGEVVTNAIFELKRGEKLKDAIRYAGGVKPSAVSQRVSIESIVPGSARVLIDANLLSSSVANNPVLFSGDVVEVLSIRTNLVNVVEVNGAVDQPGRYAYSQGLTVSQLVDRARGTLVDAYFEMAHLTRTNADGTTQLLTINLKKSMQKDPANDLVLSPQDKLKVYTVREVQYMNNRAVVLGGAVQRPATYYRSDNMRLKDILIMAGGPTPNAYLDEVFIQRRDSLDRPGELLKVNLRKLIAGDVKENIVLQDKDDIRVYSVQEFNVQPKQTVHIAGAVQQPGPFPRAINMTVKDLINRAGNLTTNAYTETAFLYRRDENDNPGPIIRINLAKALAGDPKSNIMLEDRDTLTIYTEEDWNYQNARTVRVVGAVQKPGQFQRFDNMRVLDVINMSGNLLPTAYTETAFLQRYDVNQNPGPLVKINVQKLMSGDSKDNVLLEDRDILTVFTEDEFNYKNSHVVKISGAVQKPTTLPRAENMHLLDLLNMAGNVLPNAYLETAFLQKHDVNDKPGPMIKINVKKLLAGDPKENIPLEDRDTFVIYTIDQFMVQSQQVVSIQGAVQTPGNYARAENMKISDLIQVAGNLTPAAYSDKVFVQRTNPDGTAGKLVIVDLNKIAAGDTRENIVLMDKDAISVYTKQEAMFKPSQTVEIQGAVQKVGTFPRAEGMKLSDLLTLAGGFKPDVSDRIEIAHSRTDRKAVPYVISIAGGATGMPTENPSLTDGDIVVIKSRGDYIEKPRVVYVNGAVNRPGPVVIHGNNMRVSDVMREAGGLREDAYPQGSEFTRQIALLESAGQKTTVAAIAKLNDLLNAADYSRLSAAAAIEKTKAISEAAKNNGANLIPGITTVQQSPTQQAVENTGIVKLFDSNLVSQPRSIAGEESNVNGNVVVNVASAIRNPRRSSDDMLVLDGDTINIPTKPTTIQVLGAVIQNRAVPYSSDTKVDYYINQCGGMTLDAAKDRILVLRLGGGLIPANKVKQLMAGDVILVPTKVVAAKLDSGKRNLIDDIFKNLTTSTLLILAGKKLLGI